MFVRPRFVMIPIIALHATSVIAAGQESGRAPEFQVSGPLAQRADSVLTAAEREGFSGVALLRSAGTIVLAKGYGLANRAQRVPMTANSVVQIGSNTKDFTAVAILQLVERSTLRLDDSLPVFVRDVPADKRAITIRHLLAHRAGFPLGVGSDFEPLGRDAYITRLMATPLIAPVGAREQYSNAGYSMLAAIIEIRSGKSYDEVIRDQILRPLGLRDTGFLLPAFDQRRLAHGYAEDADRGTMLEKAHASDGPWWNLRGNGGMLSTVRDMAEFYRVLFETERLLTPASRAMHFGMGATVLAGSDLVNFFLYNREPDAHLELILASTSTDLKAPMLRQRLAPILGIPSPGDPGAGRVVAGNAAPLPDTPVAATIRAYVAAFNSGDTATMRVFLRDRFVFTPGGRTIEERLSRFPQIFDDLGTLTILGGTIGADGKGEVSVRAAKTEDPVVLVVDVEPQSPYRMRTLGIRVGG
jgi:CubicO group peptidase (beta-lactamase class C family)